MGGRAAVSAAARRAIADAEIVCIEIALAPAEGNKGCADRIGEASRESCGISLGLTQLVLQVGCPGDDHAGAVLVRVVARTDKALVHVRESVEGGARRGGEHLAPCLSFLSAALSDTQRQTVSLDSRFTQFRSMQSVSISIGTCSRDRYRSTKTESIAAFSGTPTRMYTVVNAKPAPESSGDTIPRLVNDEMAK